VLYEPDVVISVYNKKKQRFEHYPWHDFRMKADGLPSAARAGYSCAKIEVLSLLLHNNEISRKEIRHILEEIETEACQKRGSSEWGLA
jgi:hypothetical protein